MYGDSAGKVVLCAWAGGKTTKKVKIHPVLLFPCEQSENIERFCVNKMSGPAQHVFEWGRGLKDKQVKMSNMGGGGGGWGYAPPEIFDFNSSQMPRNAFKINQRNP